MQKIALYDKIDENGNMKSPKRGAYTVVITDLKDVPEKQTFEIYFDIIGGEFDHYYTNEKANNGGSDKSKTYRSYNEKSLVFFKRFITSVEKSNPGYKWNWDEKTLIGKKLVAVFGEVEYVKDLPDENRVEIRTICKCVEWHSTEALNNGSIKIPEKMLLTDTQRQKYEQLKAKYEAPQNTAEDINMDDLPF